MQWLADGSHARRGSLAGDAPRRYVAGVCAGFRVDAERRGQRSHAGAWERSTGLAKRGLGHKMPERSWLCYVFNFLQFIWVF